MDLKLEKLVIWKEKPPEKILDAIIVFWNIYLVSIKQGRVSFNTNFGRHVFYHSEITEKWEYLNTEYRDARTINIFKQLVKIGLVHLDGTVLYERAL
jgi:hypothetical protein